MVFDFLNKLKINEDDTDNTNQFQNLPKPDVDAEKEWLNEEKQIKPNLGQQTVLENEQEESPVDRTSEPSESESPTISQNKSIQKNINPQLEQEYKDFISEQKPTEQPKKLNYLDLYEQARKKDEETAKRHGILLAAQTLASGIAGVTPNLELIEKMQKSTPSAVSQLDKKMEMQEKIKKIQDDEALDNPEGVASVFLREQLSQFTGKPVDPKLTARVITKQLNLDPDKINQLITTKQSKADALQQQKEQFKVTQEQKKAELERRIKEDERDYNLQVLSLQTQAMMGANKQDIDKKLLDLKIKHEKNQEEYRNAFLNFQKEQLTEKKQQREKDRETKDQETK